MLPAGAWAQVNCTATINPLTFPANMDVLPGAAFDTASSILTTCTGLTGTNRARVCYQLDNGTYPASGGARQMGSGANRLRFQVYRNATYTGVWNTTATGTIGVSVTRTAPSSTRAYYGRVLASQQTAIPASYSTSLTVSAGYVVYTGTAPACSTVPMTMSFVLNVSGTVVSSCNATAGALTFPTASLFTANVDGTSTVNVTCTNSTPYHVRLDGGLSGATTNPAARLMTLGAGQVTYGLYRDIGRSQGWGSTDGVDTSPGTGSAVATGHTVYGRIPPQTTPAPGTYTDTVVVTVSFL